MSISFKAFEVLTHQSVSWSIQLLKNALFHDIWIRFENYKSFKSQIMLGTNVRCLDNLNGIWGFDTSNSLQTTSLLLLVVGGWTNILVHRWLHPCRWDVCLSQLQVSLAHWWPWHHLMVRLHFHVNQLIKQCVLLEGTVQQYSVWLHYLGWTWRRSHDLPCNCMLCSLVPHHASGSILHSPFGEQFNNLWDTLRGKASVYAEPLEDFCILICPFIPFGTCGWGSQPHTAIIAVWHFILTVSQYVIISGVLNISQNFILEAWAMPFGVTFWYHNQKSTSSRFRVLSGSCLTAGGHTASFIDQVCIILINSFAIPGGIMNGAGIEAWACAFSCFRAHDRIVCSSGVHLLPFLALAIRKVSCKWCGLRPYHWCWCWCQHHRYLLIYWYWHTVRATLAGSGD